MWLLGLRVPGSVTLEVELAMWLGCCLDHGLLVISIVSVYPALQLYALDAVRQPQQGTTFETILYIGK